VAIATDQFRLKLKIPLSGLLPTIDALCHCVRR
jgi:hypothetical protein